MPARQSARHHAIVVAPAALLLTVASAPWGGAAAPTLEPTSLPGSLPAPSVATEAIEAPASVVRRGAVAAPGTRKSFDGAIAGASASGIPAAALSAYQRAETVINAADKSCHLPWQLIAAIGRVESDHGRVNGNTLDDQGLATPGIFGIPLDGSNNTAVIRDTDAGQYDSDAKWDRAVGPMQFIPSTWSVVGVDGDNDGQRNPQDIDDAALATAVYLCSGSDDLSTETGLRPAVYRYNHSHHYVDVVLSLRDAYLEGDFTSVPNAVSYAATFVPMPAPVVPEPEEAPDGSELARDHGADLADRPRGRQATGSAAPHGNDDSRDADAGPGPGGADPDPEQDPDVDDGTDEPGVDPVDPDDGTETPETPETPDDGEGEGDGTVVEPVDPDGEEPVDPGDGDPVDPVDETTPPSEEEATEQCLAAVGATAADLPDLEALDLLVDFNTCMTELNYPR